MFIEDHEDVRNSLNNLFRSSDAFELVQDAEDCSQALTYLPVLKGQSMLPDIILLPMKGKEPKATWAFIRHVADNYKSIKLITIFDFLGPGLAQRINMETKYKSVQAHLKFNNALQVITNLLTISLLVYLFIKKA